MKPAAHQYEDKLLELAYGELPAHEASAALAHVHGCARCSEALREIQAVRNTMGQLPMQPVPDSGLESLFAYADQAARRNAAGPAPTATWWRKLMAPLAAASALSLIGVVAWQTNKEGPAVPARSEIAEAANPQPALQDSLADQKAAANAAPTVAAPTPTTWAKEAKDEEGQAEERDFAPAKTAATKPSPKVRAGPSLGDELSKAARASNGKGRKAEEAAVQNYVDSGGKRDAFASPEPEMKKKAVAPPADKAEKVVASKDSDRAYDEGYGAKAGSAPGGGRYEVAPPAEQAKPAAPPPPPMQAQQAQQAPSAESQGSMGLGLSGASSRQQVSQRQAPNAAGGLSERERADQTDDAPMAAARAPKPLSADLDAKLKEMSAARSANDTRTELDIAMNLLRSAPAKSRERLQALASVCNGLNTLELYEKAYPYCQQLLSEYPGSSEAMAYAERQNRTPRAAKRASKASTADQLEAPAAAPASEPARKSAPSKAATEAAH
ncbi:MAG: hypothetical protein IPJ65_06980 [Archangiaceae bacterium]|nr:hypothetical protein [Archangiaceae bacterium]